MLGIPSIRSSCVTFVCLLGLVLCAPPAYAGYIDLISGTSGSGGTSGPTGTDGTGLFFRGADLSGTGRFPAFVQIGSNDPVHDAYNTTVNMVLDNGSSNQFNHEIQIDDLGTVNVGGTDYYRFFLDINEANGQNNKGDTADRLLSLDALQIYVSGTPNQSTTTVSSLGTKVYELGDNHVLLDYNLESGSGRADMVFLVPVAAFSSFSGTDYVYLYSLFGALGMQDADALFLGSLGGDYGASDGFEEWALNTEKVERVPEPGSMLLLGLGLAAATRHVRRRRSA